MQFGTNDPIMIESNSGAKFPQAMSISQYSGSTYAAFRSENEWFSVSEWFGSDSNTCQKLRRSHQYVTFKTKLIEQFENVEDAYALLWLELFKKYPAEQPRAFRLFPQLKFLHIWESFTSVQQN
jgi:hypothetical protein